MRSRKPGQDSNPICLRAPSADMGDTELQEIRSLLNQLQILTLLFYPGRVALVLRGKREVLSVGDR